MNKVTLKIILYSVIVILLILVVVLATLKASCPVDIPSYYGTYPFIKRVLYPVCEKTGISTSRYNFGIGINQKKF